MDETKKSAGAIWVKPDGSLSIKLEGKEEYIVATKQEDKPKDTYPDFKGENIAIWERVIKQGKHEGKKMLSISIGEQGKEERYVAFNNDFKKDNEKAPNWNILPSQPQI